MQHVTTPECLPAGFSLLTGRTSSGGKVNDNCVVKASLGPPLREGSCEVLYADKIRLPRAFRDEVCGDYYRHLEGNERGPLAEACDRYLKALNQRPFLLTASLSIRTRSVSPISTPIAPQSRATPLLLLPTRGARHSGRTRPIDSRPEPSTRVGRGDTSGQDGPYCVGILRSSSF